MVYSQKLRESFPDITLQAEDLLLLETFQISYLPERVAKKEFADLIIYNKHPDLFDSMGKIRWDIKEITAVASLEGKIVADVGPGSGRIAFLVAPYAQTVFAVEPTASFRSFMREKGIKQEVKNLFVMDGTLDSIPLPDDSLDVLITSNAIGWDLNRELKEIERVVKPGGTSIHLLYSEAKHEDSYHETLISSSWNYDYTRIKLEKTIKTTYYKRITDKILP